MLLILDRLVQLTRTALAQAELAVAFRAERDLGLALDAADGLLLLIRLALFILCDEAGSNLGVVLELVLGALLEGRGRHLLVVAIAIAVVVVVVVRGG